MTAPHAFAVRVYYEDTDFSGAVYHANYLRFLERARTEMLRERGISQGASLVGEACEAFGFVVRSMTIDYLRPARMDDLLTIETRLEKLSAAALILDQRVMRGEEILATATVRVACVINGRAARLPPGVRDRLSG